MPIDFKSYTILIVEDESFLSKVLAERMEDEGFGRITVAGNGEEALEQVKAHIPNIILLDMILPRMNGFEVLEHLQADPKFKKIPVLVLSNLGQDQDIEQAKTLGATDYIVKSNFSLQKVVEKIVTILSATTPKA